MRRTVLLLAVIAIAGCGGGARQDADEPDGTFKVEVVGASFPARQHIAQSVRLRLRVRNADQRTLRDVAVTVETKGAGTNAPSAFGQRASGTGQSDSDRPVWVLDDGPLGGDTADVNTWSAGTLRAGETRELTWRLVAVKAGTYSIGYRVSPGLTGRARAANGHTSGSFDVTIADEPVPARVGAGGEVVRGEEPGGN
ncbi:MAG: hypothetical protein QOE86_4094 [Solirubrobacteraceae bacterium]|nr:hypothetical protein [Solirubrobacteraceae bacterium]